MMAQASVMIRSGENGSHNTSRVPVPHAGRSGYRFANFRPSAAAPVPQRGLEAISPSLPSKTPTMEKTL